VKLAQYKELFGTDWINPVRLRVHPKGLPTSQQAVRVWFIEKYEMLNDSDTLLSLPEKAKPNTY
jgi:hypothetical protein